MYLTVILPVCIALLALAFIIVLFGKNQRKKMNAIYEGQHAFPGRENEAHRGRAVILAAQGGMVGEGTSKARLALSLQVTDDSGESYRAKTTWLVDIEALSYMQTGETLSVKIDQKDRDLIYPNASWASYVSEP